MKLLKRDGVVVGYSTLRRFAQRELGTPRRGVVRLPAPGQLGDGTKTQRTTPVKVTGLTGAVAIGAGDYHTCAVLSNGSATCWGLNSYGQLGDGTSTDRPSPTTTVAGLSNAATVSAGNMFSCSQLKTGTLSTSSPGRIMPSCSRLQPALCCPTGRSSGTRSGRGELPFRAGRV